MEAARNASLGNALHASKQPLSRLLGYIIDSDPIIKKLAIKQRFMIHERIRFDKQSHHADNARYVAVRNFLDRSRGFIKNPTVHTTFGRNAPEASLTRHGLLHKAQALVAGAKYMQAATDVQKSEARQGAPRFASLSALRKAVDQNPRTLVVHNPDDSVTLL